MIIIIIIILIDGPKMELAFVSTLQIKTWT